MILPDVRTVTLPEAERLLTSLIGVPSVNPAYDPASPGENELGEAIGDFCARVGMSVQTVPVVDGRSNVIARLPSRSPRRTLLIEAHLDTVGLPASGTIARVEHGRVFGRGACDVKGGITSALLALADLSADPLDNTDVVLLGAIDEEFIFRGITNFIAQGDLPDHAVVIEPTGLRAVTQHNGVVRIEIVVDGVAAHTSRPGEGRNAILDALTLVDRLGEWNAAHNAARSPGEPERILAVTTISGGTAINVVPDFCRVGVDLRIRPRDDARDVLADVSSMLASLAAESITARVDRELLLDGGMFTASSEPLVVAMGAVLAELGLPADPHHVPYGTDGSKLSRAGVPTIVYGPGSIEQAHADVEWVELDDVVTAARALSALARALDAAP